MRCQELREILDSYIGNELLIETNHEVLRHLENCAACRDELAARRELRTRLRSAVTLSTESQINPVFAARLQANLREEALRLTFLEKIKSSNWFDSPVILGSALAVLLILFGSWIWLRFPAATTKDFAQSNTAETITIPAETPAEKTLTQAVRVAWREMIEQAVGDHENCALEFRLPEKPISLDQAAVQYGEYNKNLDKTVTASLDEIFADKNSGKVKFLEAHSCVYNGRRFAHVVLQYRSRRISVLVTNTDLPVGDGNQVAAQTLDAMRVASFRTAHHAVFVVSDLSETENTQIAEAISPAVSRHIEKNGA